MGSVDTSISDHVTIIVKAPNQQIADQTIQCHLNWTIKKLKDYLSEVYPSKPVSLFQLMKILCLIIKILETKIILNNIFLTFSSIENLFDVNFKKFVIIHIL